MELLNPPGPPSWPDLLVFYGLVALAVAACMALAVLAG